MLLGLLGAGVLKANPLAVSPSPSPEAGTACTLQGSAAIPKGVELFDAPQGGAPIASFAGQTAPLAVLEVRAEMASRRARVRASGGLRVEGWMDLASLPLFAARDLALVPAHVWLAEGQPVRVVDAGSSSGTFSIESVLRGSFAQTVRVSVPCTALALEQHRRMGWEVPGDARGYVARGDRLGLRKEPQGAVVFSADVAQSGGRSALLWSTENRGGFVHVELHEDLIVDAWVASGELVALKQGEMMDQVASPTTHVEAARLAVNGTPTVVRPSRDVPVRTTPQDGARTVGVIESGSEVYVMETIVGWSSILPRSLNVLPAGDRSFWVKAAEIGVSSPGAPAVAPAPGRK